MLQYLDLNFDTSGNTHTQAYDFGNMPYDDASGNLINYEISLGIYNYTTRFTETDAILYHTPGLFGADWKVDASAVNSAARPVQANCKICYYCGPTAVPEDNDPRNTANWGIISQHNASSVTVDIDPNTGIGTGTYPVWKGDSQGNNYLYQILIESYVMADGRVIDAGTNSYFETYGEYCQLLDDHVADREPVATVYYRPRSSGSSGTPPQTQNKDAVVYIDGKVTEAGNVATETNAHTGLTDTTVEVDPVVFEEQLAQIDTSADTHRIEIFVPQLNDTDSVGEERAVLDLQMVENATELNAEVIVHANSAQITISPDTIYAQQLMEQFPTAANAAEVKISVVSVPADEEAASAAQAFAEANNLVLTGQIREYSLEASYGGQSMVLESYNRYLTISVNDALDKPVTTGLKSIDGGSSWFHVPTYVKTASNIYGGISDYAINTLGACIYCAGYNEVEFEDAAGTWYENTVSEMASRRILNGRDTGLFDGNDNITRAECATVVLRLLQKSGLVDVRSKA